MAATSHKGGISFGLVYIPTALHAATKRMFFNKAEPQCDILLYRIAETSVALPKKAKWKYQIYFQINPDSDRPKLQFYPPGFWRRESRKDGKDETNRTCPQTRRTRQACAAD